MPEASEKHEQLWSHDDEGETPDPAHSNGVAGGELSQVRPGITGALGLQARFPVRHVVVVRRRHAL